MLYVLVSPLNRRVVASKLADRYVGFAATTPLLRSHFGYLRGKSKPLTFRSFYDAEKYRDLNYPDFSICHYDPRLNHITIP